MVLFMLRAHLHVKLSNPITNNSQFQQPLGDKMMYRDHNPGMTAEPSGNTHLHSVQAHTSMQAFVCSASDPHAHLFLAIPKTIPGMSKRSQ